MKLLWAFPVFCTQILQYSPDETLMWFADKGPLTENPFWSRTKSVNYRAGSYQTLYSYARNPAGHRCRSKQFLGDAKDILPTFARKIFYGQVPLYRTNFLQQLITHQLSQTLNKLSSTKLNDKISFLYFLESDPFIHSTTNKCTFI